jgi:hypothetical protein
VTPALRRPRKSGLKFVARNQRVSFCIYDDPFIGFPSVSSPNKDTGIANGFFKPLGSNGAVSQLGVWQRVASRIICRSVSELFVVSGVSQDR